MSVDNTTIWGIAKSLDNIADRLDKVVGHLDFLPAINEHLGVIADAVKKLAPPVGKPGEVIQGQWGPGGPPLKVITDQHPYRTKWGEHKVRAPAKQSVLYKQGYADTIEGEAYMEGVKAAEAAIDEKRKK